jgi:uncharacterized membrane protein
MSDNSSDTQSFSQCVIAEYATAADAEVGLQVLATDGFTYENVSKITPADSLSDDEKLSASVQRETEGIQPDGSIGVGAMIGGALSIPLAIGTLIGPMFVVGPLVGLGFGAAAGGLFSATKRWGVAEDVAAEYERKLESGSTLVVVSDTDLRVHDAYKLLQTSRPLSVERFKLPEGDDHA